MKRDKASEKMLKRLLIKKYGYKCECCGWTKFVQMHHITHNPLINEEQHCILLCPNCHSLAHLDETGRFDERYFITPTELYEVVSRRRG